MNKYHHGYLLTGDMDKSLKTALKMSAEILNMEEDLLRSSADFFFFEKKTFLIDDARNIRRSASKRSFGSRGSVFVIKANIFTREAANALLKTLEEPFGLSYFFIVTSSTESVPDTLRSRLVGLTFYPEAGLSKERYDFVKKFFAAQAEGRVEMIKDLFKEKEKMIDFLGEIELFLRERLMDSFSRDVVSAIEILAHQNDFISTRSASPKIVGEHLSFVLPRLYN